MRNRPYGFDIYLVNVKTIRTIAQNFVAFSEKLNFTKDSNNILLGLKEFITKQQQRNAMMNYKIGPSLNSTQVTDDKPGQFYTQNSN